MLPRGSLSKTLVLLLVACCLHTEAARGQGRAADYRRADDLRRRVQNKVFRSRVDAHWLNDGHRFWYRVEIGPRESRFILVDAKTGQRQEAFDHKKLAAAIGKATKRNVDEKQLPIRSLRFSKDGQKVFFSAGGKSWECARATSELREAGAAVASKESTVKILPFPRVGRRQGAETNVVFVNRTESKVKLYWINNVQNPRFYADIEPGKRHEQHTYGGHTWLVTDERKRALGVFEATDADGVAIIDRTWKPGQRPDGPQNGNRNERDRDRSARNGVSPDDRWQARIVEHNVTLRDRESDEEFKLTSDGTEEDAYQGRIYWSPDSRKLVVYQRRRGDNRQVQFVESSPRNQLQPKLHSFTYDKPGDRIDQSRPRLFDVEKKERIDVVDELFSNPWRIDNLRWDADSSRFSFLYNQRGHQVLRVLAVDSDTGKAKAIVDDVADSFVCYSSKSYFRRLEETNEIIWMSERDGWNHLYLYDSKTGNVKSQITKGEWVVRGVDRVDVEARQIWFRAGGIHPDQDPYHVHFCQVNFDGTGRVTLTEGDGTHQIEFSPDRKYLVDTYSRVDLPPTTELRRSDNGSLVCKLEKADWTELTETGWRPPERFVAKGRDGETDIYGVIYRPTRFDPTKEYPVIEHIYAGPHSAHVPKRFSAFHGSQSMAELGFVVVRIDGMGTSHRSKKFHDVCWKDVGDAGFPDRVLWIKAAAKDRPWIDLSQVGIYGGSAGGQNAMRALIAHGDFYRVAVADCGCHDNRMDKVWWNEQWMGWPIGPHYAESSNVTQAHRTQGKLMLIVGELDRNVDPASTMQVVDALVKADKDFDLVIIPGAGHGAAGTRYGRRRQRDFFVRHLLGVEPRGK